MPVDSISVLTILRQNTDKNNNTTLEIYNPEKNVVEFISKNNLDSIENIEKFIQSIKLRIDNDTSKNTSYAYWQEKGWHKAIDYYASSRDNCNVDPSSFSQDFNADNELRNNVPESNIQKQLSVPQALIRRRTKRVFKNQSVQKEILNEGIKNSLLIDDVIGIQFYFIIYNVEGIEPSVCAYDIRSQKLKLIREGQFNAEMSVNIQGLHTPKTAAFTLILVADFENLMQAMPYPRGLRNTYIEAGRLSQKIVISYLQYGVHSLVTPALRDRDVSKLLKLEERNSAPLYSITCGYPIK